MGIKEMIRELSSIISITKQEIEDIISVTAVYNKVRRRDGSFGKEVSIKVRDKIKEMYMEACSIMELEEILEMMKTKSNFFEVENVEHSVEAIRRIKLEDVKTSFCSENECVESTKKKCEEIRNEIQSSIIYYKSIIESRSIESAIIENKIYSLSNRGEKVFPVYRYIEEIRKTKKYVIEIEAATGSGKTRIVPFVIASISIDENLIRPFIIITQPSRTIVQEKIEDFKGIFGKSVIFAETKEALIELYHSRRKFTKPVIGISTPLDVLKLMNAVEEANFFNRTRFIVDEVHERPIELDVLLSRLGDKSSFAANVVMMTATPDKNVLKPFPEDKVSKIRVKGEGSTRMKSLYQTDIFSVDVTGVEYEYEEEKNESGEIVKTRKKVPKNFYYEYVDEENENGEIVRTKKKVPKEIHDYEYTEEEDEEGNVIIVKKRVPKNYDYEYVEETDDDGNTIKVRKRIDREFCEEEDENGNDATERSSEYDYEYCEEEDEEGNIVTIRKRTNFENENDEYDFNYEYCEEEDENGKIINIRRKVLKMEEIINNPEVEETINEDGTVIQVIKGDPIIEEIVNEDGTISKVAKEQPVIELHSAKDGTMTKIIKKPQEEVEIRDENGVIKKVKKQITIKETTNPDGTISTTVIETIINNDGTKTTLERSPTDEELAEVSQRVNVIEERQPDGSIKKTVVSPKPSKRASIKSQHAEKGIIKSGRSSKRVSQSGSPKSSGKHSPKAFSRRNSRPASPREKELAKQGFTEKPNNPMHQTYVDKHGVVKQRSDDHVVIEEFVQKDGKIRRITRPPPIIEEIKTEDGNVIRIKRNQTPIEEIIDEEGNIISSNAEPVEDQRITSPAQNIPLVQDFIATDGSIKQIIKMAPDVIEERLPDGSIRRITKQRYLETVAKPGGGTEQIEKEMPVVEEIIKADGQVEKYEVEERADGTTVRIQKEDPITTEETDEQGNKHIITRSKVIEYVTKPDGSVEKVERNGDYTEEIIETDGTVRKIIREDPTLEYVRKANGTILKIIRQKPIIEEIIKDGVITRIEHAQPVIEEVYMYGKLVERKERFSDRWLSKERTKNKDGTSTETQTYADGAIRVTTFNAKGRMETIIEKRPTAGGGYTKHVILGRRDGIDGNIEMDVIKNKEGKTVELKTYDPNIIDKIFLQRPPTPTQEQIDLPQETINSNEEKTVKFNQKVFGSEPLNRSKIQKAVIKEFVAPDGSVQSTMRLTLPVVGGGCKGTFDIEVIDTISPDGMIIRRCRVIGKPGVQPLRKEETAVYDGDEIVSEDEILESDHQSVYRKEKIFPRMPNKIPRVQAVFKELGFRTPKTRQIRPSRFVKRVAEEAHSEICKAPVSDPSSEPNETDEEVQNEIQRVRIPSKKNNRKNNFGGLYDNQNAYVKVPPIQANKDVNYSAEDRKRMLDYLNGRLKENEENDTDFEMGFARSYTMEEFDEHHRISPPIVGSLQAPFRRILSELSLRPPRTMEKHLSVQPRLEKGFIRKRIMDYIRAMYGVKTQVFQDERPTSADIISAQIDAKKDALIKDSLKLSSNSTRRQGGLLSVQKPLIISPRIHSKRVSLTARNDQPKRFDRRKVSPPRRPSPVVRSSIPKASPIGEIWVPVEPSNRSIDRNDSGRVHDWRNMRVDIGGLREEREKNLKLIPNSLEITSLSPKK